MKPKGQSGTTLVELAVAITIIATAAATVIGLIAFMSRTSAEGMAAAQRASFANAYLTRILNRPFDEVDDYATPAGSPIQDALGNTLADLDGWSVAVEITNVSLQGVNAERVRVTVTDPFGELTILSGFKAQHP